MKEGIEILSDANIPNYRTPEQAIRSFMTLVEYGRNLESLYETPKEISVEFPVDRGSIRNEFIPIAKKSPEDVLSEELSKHLLSLYGIPVASPVIAKTEDEAVRISDESGYPVVCKIQSPDITHKSDVGGVMLNLADSHAVRRAFSHIVSNAKAKIPVQE
jgi:acetyltransferase